MSAMVCSTVVTPIYDDQYNIQLANIGLKFASIIFLLALLIYKINSNPCMVEKVEVNTINKNEIEKALRRSSAMGKRFPRYVFQRWAYVGLVWARVLGWRGGEH